MRPSLLLKGVGGLGNRVLALLTAILYSRISGRRLFVDWTDSMYADDGRNAFPLLFECDDVYPLEELPREGSVVPAVWQDRLDLYSNELMKKLAGDSRRYPFSWDRFRIDTRRKDYDADVAVYFSYFDEIERLRRHFQGEFAAWGPLSVDDVLQDVLRKHLRIATGLRERIDRFREENFGEETLGVHVRLTDKRAPYDRILARVARAVDGNRKRPIFLATDNEGVLGEFRSRYPNIVTTEKHYSPDGRPLHFDRTRKSRREGAEEALVDIGLLAACDEMVWDESSSFAYVARLMTDTPPERIHDLQWGRKIPREWRHRGFLLKWTARTFWTIFRRRVLGRESHRANWK